MKQAVDPATGGDEFLSRLLPPEFEHRRFSSSKRLMEILDPVVLQHPASRRLMAAAAQNPGSSGSRACRPPEHPEPMALRANTSPLICPINSPSVYGFIRFI